MTIYAPTENAVSGPGDIITIADVDLAKDIISLRMRGLVTLQEDLQHWQLEYDFAMGQWIADMTREGLIALIDMPGMPGKNTWSRWRRYYRFRLQYPDIRVVQLIFNRYWEKFCDGEHFRKIKNEDSAYERGVQERIARAITEGTPLPKSERGRKKTLPMNLEKKLSIYGEIERILSALAPQFEDLIGLLGQSRAQFSPDLQASRATALKKQKDKITELLRQLKK